MGAGLLELCQDFSYASVQVCLAHLVVAVLPQGLACGPDDYAVAGDPIRRELGLVLCRRSSLDLELCGVFFGGGMDHADIHLAKVSTGHLVDDPVSGRRARRLRGGGGSSFGVGCHSLGGYAGRCVGCRLGCAPEEQAEANEGSQGRRTHARYLGGGVVGEDAFFLDRAGAELLCR